MRNSEEYLQIFHEIKNSVTIVGSSLQLIAKNHPDIGEYQYWSEAMEEFDYLRHMVNDLSHSHSTKPLVLKSIDLANLLLCISSSIKSMEDSNGFFCKMSISENLPYIIADDFRVKSVITNIIKNAFDAMDKTGTIFLRAISDDSQVRIEIQDFGGGIAKEHESRIFDAFFTNKEDGSGLGLPISKQFMLEMKGSIIFESHLGDGCTFTLLLPTCQK